MQLLFKLIFISLTIISCVHSADFPIVMSYRKAITGDGYVVTMKNTSDSSVRVTLSALDKKAEKVVDAGHTWELGHAEGFIFAVQDKFRVTVGNQSVEQTIPVTPAMTVSFRKALLDSSLVLVVERNKTSVGAITVVCDRPSTQEKKIFNHAGWKTSNVFEIGHTDGWAFKKGDTVTITGDGIETIEKTAQ